MPPSERSPAEALPLSPQVFYVLIALADAQKHGYAIMKEVEQRSDGRIRLSTGTLYGIVKRLLQDGWIRESALGSTERRRAYRLTAFGRKVALAEAERLRELVRAADGKMLFAKPAPG